MNFYFKEFGSLCKEEKRGKKLANEMVDIQNFLT